MPDLVLSALTAWGIMIDININRKYNFHKIIIVSYIIFISSDSVVIWTPSWNPGRVMGKYCRS